MFGVVMIVLIMMIEVYFWSIYCVFGSNEDLYKFIFIFIIILRKGNYDFFYEGRDKIKGLER